MLVALNCQTLFLIDAKTQSFYQHANDLILILTKINENVRKYRKLQNIRDILTKLLISQLLVVLEQQARYKDNTKTQFFYQVVRHANYQISYS